MANLTSNSQFFSVADYRTAALKRLNEGLSHYIEKSAGEGSTLSANLSAFGKYQLVPRVLGGVKSVDTKVSIIGGQIETPIMVAPTAWHKMFHPQGESATSRASQALGTRFVISSYSTLDFNQIGSDLSHTWYQLLVYEDLELMKRYITKARKAGVSAIVLTVDALVGCSMCKSSPSNLPKVEFPIQELPLFPKDPAIPFSNLDDYYAKYMGSGASWNDIRQIIEFAELPVILKGILHPEDAKMAAEVGAKGIIISNHGGRQLDGAISTIDALRKVPAEVRQKLDVYMDGGIRQGSDVFKAIALGAKAVLVGRPVLYGLAADGENGVSGVLQILTNELRQCMHTMGCAKISDITADRINTTI